VFAIFTSAPRIGHMPQFGNVRTDPEEMYSFLTDDHVYRRRGVCTVSARLMKVRLGCQPL
jgi:hypothetical protein